MRGRFYALLSISSVISSCASTPQASGPFNLESLPRCDSALLSWQVVPPMDELFAQDPKSASAKRAMDAMLKMKKIDIAELRRAAEGKTG